MLMPMICVCTAPLTPMAHKSELLALIDGEIADGGLVLIVVVVADLLLTVELLVESVTIGSAAVARTGSNKASQISLRN